MDRKTLGARVYHYEHQSNYMESIEHVRRCFTEIVEDFIESNGRHMYSVIFKT